DQRWSSADIARLHHQPLPGGGEQDCFSDAETLGWCDQGAAAVCALPDDETHDRRPGSQKIRAGANAEGAIRGTPVRLGNWSQYPHLQGTPAYARLGDGRELMYVWPEKDHLKALERDPSAGDGLRFRPGFIDADVIAPARGMPGGFVTVATDPVSGGGVVF